MMEAVVELVPKIIEFGKRIVEVGKRCNELNVVVKDLKSSVDDMDREAKGEEHNSGKKRKRVLGAFFEQVEGYKAAAEETMDEYRREEWQLGFKRVRLALRIERHLNEGEDLLNKGKRLRREGLTYDDVRTRGETTLPVSELLGETAQGHLESALTAINSGTAHCIGIYGSAGAGKTNLMKHLYNKVYGDTECFKAVFWATAPEEPSNKSLQESVAEGMWFKLKDDDEVRRAGLIAGRIDEMGPGRIILFLDNVKGEFPALELIAFPSANLNHILVFTAPSQDVCNKMHCDLILKMDLLPEGEAQELFWHEAGRGGKDLLTDIDIGVPSNQELMIKEVAIQVANECARMPLAIILIARSMDGIEDIREWRNRLNELTGTIRSIHNEEAKILEQLKFGYTSLKDQTVRKCFLAAAGLLIEDRQVPKVEIITEWKVHGLIGGNRPAHLADDQGHAILNKLERLCLVEVVDIESQKFVTMNKWIRKMAATIN